MTTGDYTLRFPPDYDSEEWIWMSKGYLVVKLEVAGLPPNRYSLTVRDPTRLAQDVDAELSESGSIFAEPNVVVVPTLDRQAVERAVAELARRDFRGLVPE